MLYLLSSGSNAHGQLGNTTLDDSLTFQKCSFEYQPPFALPRTTSKVIDVATGANHTLVLLEIEGNKRELWGCGDGRKGQLGQRYQRETAEGGSSALFRKLHLSLEESGFGGYSFKLISTTWETSYVVLTSEGKEDVVIAMGSDDYGDLGIGGWNSKFASPDFHVVRLEHLKLSDPSVFAISSGQRHVILHVQIKSTSVLVGWGSSRQGQLGLIGQNNPSFISLPRILSVQSALPNDRITSCSLGIHHTVILYESGRIITLGSDRKGQLHVSKAVDSTIAKNVACTWNGTYIAIIQAGNWSILSSGSNSHNQLGWYPNETTAVGAAIFPEALEISNVSIELACGSEHVLVLVRPTLLSQSQVWGWGWNEHGNLGLGHNDDVQVPMKLWPDTSHQDVKEIKGIWGGCGTSWICYEA